MLEVVPYELDDIKNELKRKAIDVLGITDAEFEGSNVSQLINLLAYANVINNTNFTFGLNEMFISQASDRRNIIKHARQMGYTHVRKKSYQYKIKLKALKSGTLTMEKYTNFSSNGNNYVYMGNSITDVYGTYAYLKVLVNEYNNKQSDLFNLDSTGKGSYVISEEGQVCYIHEKDIGTSNRLLLESLDDNEIPVYSQLPQEVWVWDTTTYGNPNYAGYRYFEKVGTVDTFLYDDTNKIFKIQISTPDGDFPIFTVVTETKTLTSNGDGTLSFDTDTSHEIKYFNEILLNPGTEDEETLSLYEFVIDEDNLNAKIPTNEVPVVEEYDPSTSVTNDTEWNATITAIHNVLPGSLGNADIEFSDGRTREIDSDDLVLSGNNITIPFQVTSTRDEAIQVSGSSIQLTNVNLKNVTYVVVKVGSDNFIVDNFSWDDETGIVTILDSEGVADAQYDAQYVDVDYKYFEDLSEALNITLRYSYQDNSLTGKTVSVKYSYDVGLDGYLDKRFFFSDLRGEYPDNEYTTDQKTDGFNGFYASEYNSETSVLTFRVDIEEVDDGEGGTKTLKHNSYVKTKVNGSWVDAKQLHEVMITPFRKTRFSTTTRYEDVEGNVTFDEFDPAYCFASVTAVEPKDELEIIVKEGTIKRYNDLDDANNALYPELTVKATEDIVKAGHFIIEGENIENNGIEMFVTRVLPSGIIETDEPWEQREYLLAENTGQSEKTFVVLPDLDYENYINIYTKYAGTGIDMSLDFIMKLNVLTSRGSLGKTSSLIEPVDSEDFEAMYYIEETFTPHVLYIEGSDEETTESIRQNAPLFSNTANRAVTKNDYLTITEAQGFVSQAEIWGGEENTPVVSPGHVYITLVPYSRPLYFKSENNGARFYLDDVDNTDLFYPTYYQVTGKEKYNEAVNSIAAADTNVLFNILDSYKIITIQTNYVKTIYMDYTLDVQVLKYKFGQTVEETNKEIFAAIETYFKSNIEKYNAEYFNSTLIKQIDSVIGDNSGIEFSSKFSVDLYDNYQYPDKGTFYNVQLEDLTPDTEGNVGWNDRWVFEMPLAMPIEDMFEENLVEDGIVTEYGGMIVGNITNCNTDGFILSSDRLYMMLDDGTFVSINNDGDIETIKATSLSNEIRISIMYTRNSSVENPAVGDYAEHFKVGEYIIYKKQNVIMLRIYTHKYFNIDEHESRYIVNNDGDLEYDWINGYVNQFGQWIRFDSNGDPDENGEYWYNDEGTLVQDSASWAPKYLIDILPGTTLDDYTEYHPSVLDSYKTNDYYVEAQPLGFENIAKYNENPEDPTILAVREVSLPRQAFVDSIITLNINSKNENIKSRRNVFSRLREVNFV